MIQFQKNVALKDYSNFNIGGPASYFLDVKTEGELKEGLGKWRELSKSLKGDEKKVFVLGDGTNVLFSDDGFSGLVIRNSIKGIEKNNNKVKVGAGVEVSDLLSFCIENSLSGLEWAGGLPGTLGGAIRGNAGAFKGETKDNIEEVIGLNLETVEIKKRQKDECGFSYRYSIFKNQAKNEIIISAIFNLGKGSRDEIKNKISEKIEYREQKHPLEYPNLGSMFKNVPFEKIPYNLKEELSQYIKDDPFPVVPTAKLIFLVNLKGRKVGDIMVSEKHTNFMINLGNGKASDVKKLMKIVKEEIKDKFGIELEEEIMYLPR